jgi:hypothetical protein
LRQVNSISIPSGYTFVFQALDQQKKEAAIPDSGIIPLSG